MPDFSQYLDDHRDAFEDDLCNLLRIASVSADSQHQADMSAAADWVLKQFESMGLTTELAATKGHPIVYAESPPVEGAPTVLVYGHYDVQPPDPLDEWISPPFEPTKRNGNVYARGSTDDKGQMLTHVKSGQTWLETEGSLPIQLKYLIEGEEEVGSENLETFLEERREQLACDVVVISDTSQFGPGQPAITYGLRGIAYFELHVTGPRQDLHSGTFGGAVGNPLNALSKMLAGLIDDDGRIQVPGFYDDVVPLSDQERNQFAALNFDQAKFMNQIGVKAVQGEAGFTTLERRWARPTYDVHGFWGGYSGEGGKTVLPCRAAAKFSFRLAPDQDPKKIAKSLEEYLRSLCPAGVEMELIDLHSAPGVVVPLDSPFVSAAATAIERGFGTAPVFIREGGSIPIVNSFTAQLGADTLLLGWGLDDDNTHSPNEKFCLADFHRGIKASAYLWEELGKIKKQHA